MRWWSRSQDVDRRSWRNQDVKGSLMQKCEYVRSEISIAIVGVSKLGHDILNAGNALLRGWYSLRSFWHVDGPGSFRDHNRFVWRRAGLIDVTNQLMQVIPSIIIGALLVLRLWVCFKFQDIPAIKKGHVFGIYPLGICYITMETMAQ